MPMLCSSNLTNVNERRSVKKSVKSALRCHKIFEKMLNVRFAALSNKELRSLRCWSTFSRNKFYWLLATYASIEDHDAVKFLP